MHQTVSVIFEDPGVQELLVKLYHKGTSNFHHHLVSFLCVFMLIVFSRVRIYPYCRTLFLCYNEFFLFNKKFIS